MMPMNGQPIDVLPVNGFYISDSLPISAQECLNWYVNVPSVPSRSAAQLFGTPGIAELASTGTIAQTNRGSITLNGVPYFVNGTKLYRLNADFSIDELGVIPAGGRVSLAQNGSQVVILLPGAEAYVFTPDPDTLTEITDPDFRANGNPEYVVFIDGYFVFTTDSKRFINSALNDGLSYNALDFGSAEANPDNTVAPFTFKNQLYIAGQITTEAFQNVGGTGFPFTRSGLYLSKGVTAPLSIIEISDTMMWIGAGARESSAIWALAGNTTKKVSTTAIDNVLQDLTEDELLQVFAWSYAEKGAYFVAFTLPTTCFVLDTITGKWHERKSLVEGSLLRFRVNSIISAYGRVIVFDRFDGRIGELSKDVLTEYGDPIIRRVSGVPFSGNGNRIRVTKLEAVAEQGVGNAASPDPQISLDVSDDGGRTWRDERLRKLGRIGNYNHRTIWRRLGAFANDVVFRFTMSEPVKPVLISAKAWIK